MIKANLKLEDIKLRMSEIIRNSDIEGLSDLPAIIEWLQALLGELKELSEKALKDETTFKKGCLAYGSIYTHVWNAA